MSSFVGRVAEKKILEDALHSTRAELIAMYGRRRIGKTFLIRSVYEKYIRFEFTGTHNATLEEQLQSFSLSMKKAINSPIDLVVPINWIAAFHALEKILEPIVKKSKTVIFFDEFPWIHTPKSNFLSVFEHFWNTWASRHKNLTVVICGSAASWMIKHIVNNKGGLHNRVTKRIRLQPFTLGETEAYFKSRAIKLDRYQLLTLYMAMGGVPHYLNEIRRGESATQAIDRLFFSKDGILKNEFDILYESLFDDATNHTTIIRLLYSIAKGMTRNELLANSKFSSGGTITQLINELEESGFITGYVPFDKVSKEIVYRLTDEYSIFYMRFVEKRRTSGTGTWLRLSESNFFKSWSGYAFESICLKHIAAIKKALKISNIYADASVWRQQPGKGQPGAQIDLLLDRRDRCINICEMKFATEQFVLTKKYVEELVQKQAVFAQKTKSKKTLFLTMITTYGVARNDYYKAHVQQEVKMDALFV
jgi:uncharacterized protein